MTQRSRPQADNNATLAYIDSGPYSRDQWAERIRAAHTGDANTALQRTRLRGVVPTYDNMLVAGTAGGPAAPITVGTGAGIVYGSYLFNSASVSFSPGLPAGNPRIDLVCMIENNTNAPVADGTEAQGWVFPTVLADYNLAASVPAYTARLAIVKGTPAAGPAEPVLDQTATLYMVPIAKYQISVAGAITAFEDRREFVDVETIVGCNATENDEIHDALIMGTAVNDGAGAAGLGAALRATLENANGDIEDAGQLAIRWTDAANGSEDARFELRLSAVNTDNLSAVINAPTATSADGNARGAGSVDLQAVRAAATEVASGSYAFVCGSNCTASGNNSHACGSSTTSSGQFSTAEGTGTVASGESSHAEGAGGTASGQYSHKGGGFAVASLYGQWARASGNFAANSDAQTSVLTARGTTAGGGVAIELFLDGAAGTQRMVIPASSAWAVDVLVIAMAQNAADAASFHGYCMIYRDNAGTTSVTGAAVTAIVASGCNVTLTADDVNESLLIQFSDDSAHVFRVVATVRLAQVSYP